MSESSEGGGRKTQQNGYSEGIRVVGVPLTSRQAEEVNTKRLCKVERDLRAYTCLQKALTVEAAVRDYPSGICGIPI